MTSAVKHLKELSWIEDYIELDSYAGCTAVIGDQRIRVRTPLPQGPQDPHAALRAEVRRMLFTLWRVATCVHAGADIDGGMEWRTESGELRWFLWVSPRGCPDIWYSWEGTDDFGDFKQRLTTMCAEVEG